MDHPAFDLQTHKLGRPQTLAQFYDAKRYPLEKQQLRLTNVEGSYPYQYSGHGVRGYPEEVKQQNFGSHNPRHGAIPDYSHLTAMQQRQEYMQRVAHHQQQLLQQREHLDRVAEQNKMAAARVAPHTHDTAWSPRNIHGYGEHYEQMSPRNSAFTYTSVAASAQQHGKGVKLERRPSIDSILGAGYSSHQPTQAMMAVRAMNPRQYHHHQEHYAAAAQGQVAHHPRDLATNKAAQDQLREWEAQADQMYAKYAAAAAGGHGREIPSNRNDPSHISPPHPDMPPEQLDSQLARFKNIVQNLEFLKEQQKNKYKSSAFQYLEKYGATEVTQSHVAGAQQTAASTPAKKNYQFHNMPPPHQHVSSTPKYTKIPSPQKSPAGRYLNPSVEHQQQMAYYQQQYQAAQQRHHQQANQGRLQHPPNATYKKDVSPLQMLSQGLPKIVDVRSLANGTAATVIENSAAALNRRRRSNEPYVVDNRSVRMRSDSSPEGYVYEISDTRSAGSCDGGVESLASPDAHMYNRNAMVLAQQQQQLEAAKAQHAASIEAMKRQQNQQRTRNPTNAPNVRLERAGSPRKLSEIMEKDKVCPSMFKGIDSLTCKCQACLLHQEKTEIQIRDLYREWKIKRLSGSSLSLKPPPSTVTTATASKDSSQPQSDVILIEDEDKGDSSQKRPASSESQSKAKRLKTSDENDNIVALDLSKKTVTTSKPEETKPINAALDLKVQSKSDAAIKKVATTGELGDLMVEQVIASCIRSAKERISNCEKLRRRHGSSTTSFEQIITECIDRECAEKGQQVRKIKNVHSVVEELKKKEKPSQPTTDENLAFYLTDSSQQKMETNNNILKDEVEILSHDKDNKQQILNQENNSKQQDSSCKDDINEQDTKTTLKQKPTQPTIGQSFDDMALLQNQVVLTDLKVMIPKLKVNSDMIVPIRDDSSQLEEPSTPLQRTASVLLLHASLGDDDSDTMQRVQSVGLSNTMSKGMDAPAGYPKSSSDLLKEQLLERPLSAPSCETLPESQHTDSVDHKQVFATKPQGSQNIPNIPKKLRDCWDEKTKVGESNNKVEMQSTLKSPAFMPKNLKECWGGGDDKKTKELGSPKMQWKAQWAIEKQSTKKSDQSLCEVCGTTNAAYRHQSSSSVEGSKMETAQNLVKEKDANRSKETGKTISLQALFQSKKFQNAVNATIKPLLECEDKPDRPQTTHANPVEPVHPLPMQTSSLALIEGKQQGKATIFHKQPEKKTDQILKPVNFKLSNLTHNGVSTGKKDGIVKHEGKQFPRLAPSPTAAIESSYEVQEHGAPVTNTPVTSHDCLVSQPAVQVPIRNVLRVIPNVQIPATVSSLPTSAANAFAAGGMVVSKPQNVQVTLAKSSVLEPIVEELPSMQHDQQQDAHTRAQTQYASSAAPVTLPAANFFRTQSVPLSSNMPSVLSSPTKGLIDLSKSSRESRPVSTPIPNQSKPSVDEDLKKSSEQFVAPTSIVQPIMQTTTTVSVAQMVAVKPKTSICTSEIQPIALSKSISKPVMETVVTEKTSSSHQASESVEPVQMVSAGDETTTALSPMHISNISHLKPPLEETTCNDSPPILQSIVQTSSKQTVAKATSEQPINQMSSAQSTVHIQTTAGQMAQASIRQITSVSRMQDTNTPGSSSTSETKVYENVTQAGTLVKPAEFQQKFQEHLKTTAPIVTPSEGDSHLDNLKDQGGVDQPLSLVTRPSGSSIITKTTTKLPQSQPTTPLPKMPALIPTSITSQPPLLLISSGPGQRPLLPAPMKIQVTRPVAPVSTVTFVASTAPVQPVVTMQSAVLTPSAAPILTPSAVPIQPAVTMQSAVLTPTTAPVQPVLTPPALPIQPAVTIQSAVLTPSSAPVLTPSLSAAQSIVTMQATILTPPKEPSSQLQLVADVRYQQQDTPSESQTESDLDMILPLPLENVNRRMKSNAPHIHVPTASGYIRYQKDSNNMREIYRVEVANDDLQPLDLKVSPKKKQTISASKVIYHQHNFPCVIRTEVPFVSPQMLQEAFFAAVDYSDFNYALRKGGIIHRYMTMQEQGAMSRACVTRTWNGSCKLIPLNEFDSKFEQITTLLEQGKEEQKDDV